MTRRTTRRLTLVGTFLVGLAVVLAAPRLLSPEPLSKPAYEARVQAAYVPLQQAFAATAEAEPATLPSRLDTAVLQLRRTSEELDEATPPTEVAQLHTTLVDGMAALADELAQVASTSRRTGTLASITAYNDAIAANPSIAAIAEAAETMKFMGYDLGRIAEE